MIIVFNAGSSSLKFSLFEKDGLQPHASGIVENILGAPFIVVRDAVGATVYEQSNLNQGYEAALATVMAWVGDKDITMAGHRVVHGGTLFSEPVRIDEDVIEKLRSLIPLAPLHQPYNVEIIEAFYRHHKNIPQVACFDTAFHRTQSKLSETFAIPREYTAEGIIRYGFHGISYQYIASVLPEVLGDKAKHKTIVAHLGNGASMCAMENLQSVATTMGFSALDGLMMGTRAGSIDAGIALYLLQQKNISPAELEHILYKESGLKGVSGISYDMRVLEESNKPAAKEALALYCYQAVKELGKLVFAMQGVEQIVFTAGVGEHSPYIRQEICSYLDWLGVLIDKQANNNNQQCISTKDSAIGVYVIPTNEEKIIAEYTRALGK